MTLKSIIKSTLKTLLPHRKDYYYRRIFQRITPSHLVLFLRSLGVQSGMILLVHSAFSRLGYFPPGAIGLINLLLDLVGPEGTLVMPAFSFIGSMQEYVESQPVYNLSQTPSASGYLTEAFRLYPGVLRSLHPTHSVCALGMQAEELIRGHEHSLGPCGAQSPFGKLVELDAYVLRLGTGSLTLYHHVQELVDFPNLFLPDLAKLLCYDEQGRKVMVETRVYRRQIPNILFLGEDTEVQGLNVHPRDFPLLYSGEREEHLRNDTRRKEVLLRLLDIRANFEANGWLMRDRIGSCVFELFNARKYVTYAVGEETSLITGFRSKYNLAILQSMLHEGKYPN